MDHIVLLLSVAYMSMKYFILSSPTTKDQRDTGGHIRSTDQDLDEVRYVCDESKT